MPPKVRPLLLRVRRYRWSFEDVCDRDWFARSPAISRWFDVYTLMVPDNEAFYIRTLTPCIELITDEAIRTELRNFFRQESLHGVAHRAYWVRMQELGVEYASYLKFMNWLVYSVLEPAQPHRLRVSIVAAIEHINACLGHVVLKRDLMRSAHSRLRELFYWHFAEEIEHKAVAHRTLATCYPGYATRILGALVAFPAFYFLSFFGMIYLLWREKSLFRLTTVSDLFQFWVRDGVLRDTLSHLARYFRISFEPWDENDFYLIDKVIGERGLIPDQGRVSPPEKLPD